MRYLLIIATSLTIACSNEKTPVIVGSKNFTESVILGEIVAQALEKEGCAAERRANMGGTFVCDKAITSGAIDAYVEYSGTALTAILKEGAPKDPSTVTRRVVEGYAKRGLAWGPELGFNNTFAMIVRRSDAEKLGLTKVSDLTKAPHFRPGFGYEFVERPDGWKGLLTAYELSFTNKPQTMDLGLTYKALASGSIDLIAGNSTDGLIDALGLVALADDRKYFPPYDAAIVRGAGLEKKCSGSTVAFQKLARRIDDATMRRLNFEVDGKHRDVKEVAAEFLAR